MHSHFCVCFICFVFSDQLEKATKTKKILQLQKKTLDFLLKPETYINIVSQYAIEPPPRVAESNKGGGSGGGAANTESEGEKREEEKVDFSKPTTSDSWNPFVVTTVIFQGLFVSFLLTFFITTNR